MTNTATTTATTIASTNASTATTTRTRTRNATASAVGGAARLPHQLAGFALALLATTAMLAGIGSLAAVSPAADAVMAAASAPTVIVVTGKRAG